MIPLRDQELLRLRFKDQLTSRIRIDFFSQKPSSVFIPGRVECALCPEIQTLLEELSSLNDRISLSTHFLEDSAELARSLGIDMIPAVVVRGQNNRPIRYFGIPSGTMFPGFIDTLVDASRGTVELEPETVRNLKKLKSDLHLQVLVTTQCGYSPAMARTAIKFALQSSRVKTDIIEIGEFPAMTQRLKLRAVPVTVFEDKLAFPGVMPEETLLQVGLRVLEGKPLSGEIKSGPSTPIAFQQPQQQQQQQQSTTRTASGLILPR